MFVKGYPRICVEVMTLGPIGPKVERRYLTSESVESDVAKEFNIKKVLSASEDANSKKNSPIYMCGNKPYTILTVCL